MKTKTFIFENETRIVRMRKRERERTECVVVEYVGF